MNQGNEVAGAHFQKSTEINKHDNNNHNSEQVRRATFRENKTGLSSGHDKKKVDLFSSRFVGAMVENPQSLGFKKVTGEQLPVPKYLLKTQTLFESSSFVQNEWDCKNQEMLAARESEFQGDPQVLFQEFQTYRKKEREEMEKLNLVDKENAKKSLDAAISFRGSCQDMCPTFERVEREFKNQVSRWEKDPNTGRISKMFAIKTFMRPSGQPPSLPSDVRPPKVLLSTLNYIIDNLLDKLPDSQSFIWDRTRSIRQDFTFQNNYSGIESIDCHERICRIHVLSLHVMAAAHDPDYQQQQEIEQFNNSLQTLTHMYDDVRSRGGICPNEAEFRAYELISKIDDTELDRNLQRLPEQIISAPILQRAIFLRGLISRGVGKLDLYSTFFKAIFDGHTPFLLACLTEIHFNMIRYNAFSMLARSLHSKAKTMPDAQTLSIDLGFDTVDELLESCKLYSLPILTGPSQEQQIEVTALKTAFKRSQAQPYTKKIDAIPHPANYRDIVNGGQPNYALNLSSAPSLEEIARQSFHEGKKATQIVNKILEGNFQLVVPKISQFGHSQGNGQTSSNQPVSFSLPQPVPTSSNNNTMSGSAFKPSSGNAEKQPGNSPFGTNNLQIAPLKKQESNFGYSANSDGVGVGSNSTTSGSFTSEIVKNNKNIKFAAAKVNPLTDEKPTFNFGQSLNNNSVVANPSNPFPQNNFDKPAYGIFGGNDSSAISVKPPAQPVEETKHKLVENKLFDTACRSVIDTMVHKLVSETAQNFAEEEWKVVKQTLRAKEQRRGALVKELSVELYEAFIREQMYLAVLRNSADFFRSAMIKKFTMKCIVNAAAKASVKHKQRIIKADEIKQFKQHIVPDIIHSIAKNPNRMIMKGPYLPKDNSGSIDIGELLAKYCQQDGELKMLFIWRDNKDTASKWLINKTGLKRSTSGGTIFREVASANGVSLHMESLSDSFTPKRDFKQIDFVVIQIGTIDEDRKAKAKLSDKLLVDSKVLAKVMGYLSRYNKRHFTSVLLTFFSSQSQNTKDMDDRIAVYLKLDSYNRRFTNANVKLVNLSDIFKCRYREMKEKLKTGLADMLKQEHTKKIERTHIDTTQGTSSINTTTDSNAGNSLVDLVHSKTPRRRFDERRVAYIKSQLSQTGKKMFKVRFKRRRMENETLQNNTYYDMTGDHSDSSSSISLLSNTSVPISTGHFNLQPDQGVKNKKTNSIIDELNKLSDEVLKD